MEEYKAMEIGRAIDITGKVSGRLTILNRVDIGKKDTSYWLAECSCGKRHVVRSADFTAGKIKSCGCLQREQAVINGKANAADIVGQKFGRLTVIKREPNKNGDSSNWLCKCECGNEKTVNIGNLKSGNAQSCGCISEDKYKEIAYSYVGQKYNRLTVVKPMKEIKQGKRQFLLKCECGKNCYGDIPNLKNGNKKSCGCYGSELLTKQNKSKDMRLENHPRWNPNLTDEDRRINRNRISSKGSINEWRKLVYERDYWTCQVCKVKGKKINAHHINGWNWAKEQRYDTDNGVTLCNECHASFHYKYGYGDNTKQQFEDYLKLNTAQGIS